MSTRLAQRAAIRVWSRPLTFESCSPVLAQPFASNAIAKSRSYSPASASSVQSYVATRCLFSESIIALHSEYGKSKELVMNVLQYGYSSLKCASLVLLIMVTVAGGSGAQQSSDGIPDNARKKSYGDGWECVRGYKEANGACTKTVIPKNAFATGSSYGRSWECRRGYQASGESCAQIAVPANGYLNSYGDGWRCNRGYQRIAEDCKAVEVPANAYLTNSGYGAAWECERGFRVVGSACEAVKLPPNAHLNYSGRDWECDRPYQKERDRCVEP